MLDMIILLSMNQKLQKELFYIRDEIGEKAYNALIANNFSTIQECYIAIVSDEIKSIKGIDAESLGNIKHVLKELQILPLTEKEKTYRRIRQLQQQHRYELRPGQSPTDISLDKLYDIRTEMERLLSNLKQLPAREN